MGGLNDSVSQNHLNIAHLMSVRATVLHRRNLTGCVGDELIDDRLLTDVAKLMQFGQRSAMNCDASLLIEVILNDNGR